MSNMTLPPMAEQGNALASVNSSALILDPASMTSIMDFANFMAKGRSTIPAHFRGNSADCAAVIMQSMRWRMDPFAVAQKTHVVNDTLGYEAQLVNAVIQSSGVTVDRFNYEWYGPWERIIGKTKVITMPAKGDKKEYQFRVPDYGMQDENGLGVRVWATLRGEDAPRVIELLLVQASVRNSPLWASDPKQQLAYLAVKRWTRLYAPDVILGVYTPDELDDGRQQERDITPSANRNPGAGQIAPAAAEWIDVEPLVSACTKTTTDANLMEFWALHNPTLKGQPQDHKRLKDAVTAHRQALKTKLADRTIDMPAATAPAQHPEISPELDGLVADMEAAADGGPDALEIAWASLSGATRAAIAGTYDKLVARAAQAEA